ncbi:MAG: hypothetical protein WCK34_03815 [Bacteroidota bacterium]
MKAEYKHDNSFGPVGATAGVMVFVAGVILVFFHLTGIILILTGAFVGFSSSSTILDYDNRRIMFSNNIFGIIKTGKWILIEPGMKLGIRESNQAYRAYSQGNRTLDLTRNDFRIFLGDAGNKEIMVVKKCESLYAAREECKRMAASLGIKQL